MLVEFGWPSGQVFLYAIDMVFLATKAHRIGKGDFIWFGYQSWGYQPRKKAVTWRCSGCGSHVIMLTQKAARSLQVFLSSGFKRADHIDLLLKQWCCDSERLAGAPHALCGTNGLLSRASQRVLSKHVHGKGGTAELLASGLGMSGHSPFARSAWPSQEIDVASQQGTTAGAGCAS